MVAPSFPVLTDLAASNDDQPSLSLSIIRKKKTNTIETDQSAPSTPPARSGSESQSLEERVAELESKLATLSHLMARRTSSASSPLTVPRSLDNASLVDSPSHASVPPLESPYPSCPSSAARRRMSEVLLREDSDLRLDSESRLFSPSLSDDSSLPETPPETPPDEPKSVGQKWLDYMESFQESTPNVDVQMEEFVRVPWQLEYLLNFGFCICVDSYLYILTVLPLKFLWSIIVMMSSWNGKHKFHRRHFYTVIQVFIIYFTYRVILVPISIGQLYHWIRGQAMLKLYVLIAIVEVFDRLMCCMGQDCLDSMYWNTTRRPRSMRMVVSVTVVMIYVMCHTLILFVHVATLNVAINSADHALLTVLISGNFAEIKSTVFKKYNRPNLFKVTAADICERFKLALFLALVLLLNLCQGMDWKRTIDYLSMCAFVWGAEMLADWIKHSFITKFNFIPSKVYPEYALLLAGDVTGIGHEGVNLDHSHAVVKRIGFAQIPLVCVMLRLVTEAGRYYEAQHTDGNGFLKLAMLVIALWGVLFGIKLLLGSYLQRICTAKLESAPELVNTPIKSTKKRN